MTRFRVVKFKTAFENSPVFTVAPRPPTAPLVRAWALGAARAQPRMDSALWSPAGRPGSRHWLARGAWAMERVAALTDAAEPAVWLPGDFCFGATAALRARGARLVFYPVDDASRPDWSRCRALAETKPCDVFVLVHAFGIENDGGAARAFADGHGALLLEDAAHALAPSGGIGQAGDAVFFSPHKWFAAPDGAMLWLRDGLAYDPPPPEKTPTLGWALKRLIQDLLPAALQPAPARRGPLAFDEDPAPAQSPPPAGMSPVAMGLLSTVTADVLADAAARRRENHAAWTEALKGLDGYRIAPAPAAPYRCVVMGGTSDRARALFDAARATGVPAETWPDVPPAVAADPETHAAALDLRRRRVLLPIHQDIRPADIPQAGLGIRAALRG